jgi:cobalamin biosynthesis protein CbiD
MTGLAAAAVARATGAMAVGATHSPVVVNTPLAVMAADGVMTARHAGAARAAVAPKTIDDGPPMTIGRTGRGRAKPGGMST